MCEVLTESTPHKVQTPHKVKVNYMCAPKITRAQGAGALSWNKNEGAD